MKQNAGSLEQASSRTRGVWQIHAVGAFACLVTTVAAVVFGAMPLFEQAAERRAQRQELIAQQQSAARLLVTRAQLDQKLRGVEQSLAEARFRLQPVDQVNKRVMQLTDLATASGLVLHEIRPGEVEAGTHYNTVTFHLSGVGTYSTCTQFLRQLSQTFPDTGVDTFRLSATGAPARPEARVMVRLAWYAAPGVVNQP